MKRILNIAVLYFKRLNKLLLLLCTIAGCYSVVLLYTLYTNEISAFVTQRHYIMQAAMTGMGILAALILNAINYRFLSRIWFVYVPIILIATLLLFTPLGMTVEGANDIGWLNLGFVSIQPSEFLKIAFIMSFATHLYKVGKRMNKFPHIILLTLHGLFPVALIGLQKDNGSAMVFLFIFLSMMFVAGIWWRYILFMMVSAPIGVYIIWNYIMEPYHKHRILVIFDKELQAEQLDIFEQQRKSLIAIGSGELTGIGLNGGDYTYVPEIQNDFIFSYIGMALGFIGAVATVGLLMLICVRIFHISLLARDMLGKLICIGVFTLILYHSAINIGMVLAAFPVIGIPLPFISAGGSSLLATFMGIGLVLSVFSHKDKQYHMFYTEKD